MVALRTPSRPFLGTQGDQKGSPFGAKHAPSHTASHTNLHSEAPFSRRGDPSWSPCGPPHGPSWARRATRKDRPSEPSTRLLTQPLIPTCIQKRHFRVGAILHGRPADPLTALLGHAGRPERIALRSQARAFSHSLSYQLAFRSAIFA